jgi:Ca2+:H+ antiporter
MPVADREQEPGVKERLLSESALVIAVVTVAVFFTVGAGWFYDLSSPLRNTALFAWLFVVMIGLSFRVVHHADALAVKLGEPFGTLILTLSVISIEVVVIVAVMITGDNNPTLARDTMFSVTYLGVIVPLAVVGLILPSFTASRPGGEPSSTMAVFLILVCVALYGVFLLMQSSRQRMVMTGTTITMTSSSAPPAITPSCYWRTWCRSSCCLRSSRRSWTGESRRPVLR